MHHTRAHPYKGRLWWNSLSNQVLGDMEAPFLVAWKVNQNMSLFSTGLGNINAICDPIWKPITKEKYKDEKEYVDRAPKEGREKNDFPWS